MKPFKLKLLIILFAIPLMACENEIIPPASEQEIIENISKTWSCDMIEDGSEYGGYEITITNNTSEEAKINISNFHKTNETIYAYVSKDLVITIPEQDVGNQTFKGEGDVSNDYTRISWNYTIETSDGTVVVTGVSTYGGEI